MTHKPFDCFLEDYREILPLGTVVEWNFSCQLGAWLDDIVYHSFVRYSEERVGHCWYLKYVSPVDHTEVDLLPEITVVSGDPFNSDPEDPELMGMEMREKVVRGEELLVIMTEITMVDLPLGATENRVCGPIDIEKALTEGVKAFEPGLLTKANRGILCG
ncbi:hypothetical protein RHMOL_Rhmol06G0172400 [Rhododendron molle]|uniref:Uncharacterized protein n=1 Tax=Rhododendron molle TaxID=49168 RepID=A0ACC0NEE0_RHOML|nr:hypothetical protein RHMOL_Rhmol06G0172400 [Rhododendron molle]